MAQWGIVNGICDVYYVKMDDLAGPLMKMGLTRIV